MLAYLFCHWKVDSIDRERYETALCRFHGALFANRPPGFHGTRVLTFENAPWIDRASATWEDWNIVADSAALDALNRHAVAGPCAEPHADVASLTHGSTAGLYQLVAGNPRTAQVRIVTRFDKPRGLPYAEFYALLEPVVRETNSALWARMMNLGAGPEFCLHADGDVHMPKDVHSTTARAAEICRTLDRGGA